MSQQSNSSTGIGFGGLLAIVFITLKLTKVIDWSWWWVTAPIWIPIVFIGIILVVVLMLKKKPKKTLQRQSESKFQARMREMMEQHKKSK